MNWLSQTSQSSQEDLIVIGSAAALIAQRTVTRRKKKKFRINPYLLDRPHKGRFIKDFEDMIKYPPAFQENFHMSIEKFELLLSLLDTKLAPKHRSRPDSLSAREQLCITLEYLCSGSMQRHIASTYRVSKQRLGFILERTCTVIVEELLADQMKDYQEHSWLEISNRFNEQWNFPNCVGAIDGKHVEIVGPPNAGSLFYNYKGHHSLVLMAVADANYRFIYFDIGGYGSEGDSTVFQQCTFGRALNDEKLRLPRNANVNGQSVPFVFVADDAFPLHKRIMKPYKPKCKGEALGTRETNFNYRLSRARRCVENCFGILAARFSCLAGPLHMTPTKVQKIVAACCVLHNFLMQKDRDVYCPLGFGDQLADTGEIIEGAWRQNRISETSIGRQTTGRPTENAKKIREVFCDYVNSIFGSVPWH